MKGEPLISLDKLASNIFEEIRAKLKKSYIVTTGADPCDEQSSGSSGLGSAASRETQGQREHSDIVWQMARWPQDRWDSDGFRSGRQLWSAILVARDKVLSEL